MKISQGEGSVPPLKGAYKHRRGCGCVGVFSTCGTWGQALVHEVTHTTEGTMGNAALAAQLSSIMGDEALYGELSRREYFKGNGEEVKAFMEPIMEKVKQGTELTAEEAEARDLFLSEAPALLAEKILGDGHFIRRLVVEQGSVAEKILVKLTELKESLSRMTSKDAKSLHRAVVKAEGLYLKAVEEAGYRFDGGKFVGSEEDEEKEGPATVKKSRKAIAYENAPANSDIISMVAKVKSGEFKDNEPVNLGMVSDEIAEQIQKITGINVHGYKMVIEARQIKHILKDHGEKGRANQSMADPQDIAKMEYALENPDTIVNAGKTRAYFYMRDGYNRTADTVRYEKNIGDENYYVIQAVPETNAKTLFVVSAYIGTQEHNKKASQLANVHGDDHAPDVTSEIDAANASDNRIAQKSEFVKRDFSEGKVKESRKAKSQTSVELTEGADVNELLEKARAENAKLRGEAKDLRVKLDELSEVSFRQFQDKIKDGQAQDLFYKLQAQEAARRIYKESKATAGLNELMADMETLLHRMLSRELSYEEAKAEASRITDDFVGKQKAGRKVGKNAHAVEVLETLRSAKIRLTETQVKEVVGERGSYDRFRKSVFGRLKFTKVNGVYLDSLWQEWSELYPELFKTDIAEGDMPAELARIYDEVRKNRDVVEYFWDDEVKEELKFKIFENLTKEENKND